MQSTLDDRNARRPPRTALVLGGAQVVIVSATLPTEVLEITQKFMTDPIRVLVKRDELTLEVRMHAHVRTRTQTRTLRHTHTHAHTFPHARASAHRAQARMQAHTNTCARGRTHSHTCAQARTRTHACTSTCTHWLAMPGYRQLCISSESMEEGGVCLMRAGSQGSMCSKGAYAEPAPQLMSLLVAVAACARHSCRAGQVEDGCLLQGGAGCTLL